MHACGQIASYAFLFPNEASELHRMLLPLLDLINHGDAEAANLDIMQAEDGSFYAYALRDIRAGEEVGCPLAHPSIHPTSGSEALARHAFEQTHTAYMATKCVCACIGVNTCAFSGLLHPCARVLLAMKVGTRGTTCALG